MTDPTHDETRAEPCELNTEALAEAWCVSVTRAERARVAACLAAERELFVHMFMLCEVRAECEARAAELAVELFHRDAAITEVW